MTGYVGSEPNLSQALGIYMDKLLNGIYTAMPGKIVSYNQSKQRARITPQINKVMFDGTVVKHKDLLDVPVLFPASGGASITLPVSKGDTVLLLFSCRSMEDWLLTGDVVTPEMDRCFHLSDAIAVPGLLPSNKKTLSTSDSKLEIVYGKTKIIIDKSGKVAIGNAQAELLAILDDLITKLTTATTPTPMGPQLLSIAAADLPAMKAKLALIKGSI